MKWIAASAALALSLAAPVRGQAAEPIQAPAGRDEALVALRSVDQARLHSDKAYAQAMLLRVAAGINQAGSEPFVADFEILRATALATLERSEEAVAAARRAAAARPADGSIQAGAVFQAARAERPSAALDLLEGAVRSVRDPAEVALLREGLSEELVRWMRIKLKDAKAEPEDARLSLALLALQWPSPDRPGIVDSLRRAAIKASLPGDVARARALLAEMTDPAVLLPILVSHRFDSLFAGDSERLRRLDAAIAAFDKGSAERLRRNPNDPDMALDRAQFLRGLGREKEALAVLAPWVDDMKRTEAGGEKAFWLVNEAAYALRALGRGEEAVAAMEKIITLDMDVHPYLISMAINQGEILNSAKRHAEAARYAENLYATAKDAASVYGHMWMWSIAACAYARAGEPARAAPWLKRLEASSDENQPAHMRALLCNGDLDAAERLLLKRLDGEDSDSLLVQLQDYGLDDGGRDSAIDRQMAAVKARPAVAAAIARRGRILRLPLSRTYWGDF
ncbi:MAG: hypothetical protein QOG72_3057 [Sphingomonadales bacterium]|jgi:tetratricopeptide (TPR) repeat protein|nr:hypothetical protein [Sphingomonadales bacterium]